MTIVNYSINTQPIGLDTLHDDVLINIFENLQAQDLLSVAKTCKLFHAIILTPDNLYFRAIWNDNSRKQISSLNNLLTKADFLLDKRMKSFSTQYEKYRKIEEKRKQDLQEIRVQIKPPENTINSLEDLKVTYNNSSQLSQKLHKIIFEALKDQRCDKLKCYGTELAVLALVGAMTTLIVLYCTKKI